MKRRWIVCLAMLVVFYFAILAFVSPLSIILFGLIRNESFYAGRPTSYWSPAVRAWTQSRFGIKRDPLMEKMMKLLNLSDEIAKPQVLEGGRTALQVLIALLKDEDSNVRQEAAVALGNLGPLAKPAIPALSATLTDQDSTVRYRAAEALGHIGPNAVGSLVEALKDEDPRVRWSAEEALKKIDPEEG
jgi:HEAT repeat protein